MLCWTPNPPVVPAVEPLRKAFAIAYHFATATGAGQAVGLDHYLDPYKILGQGSLAFSGVGLLPFLMLLRARTHRLPEPHQWQYRCLRNATLGHPPPLAKPNAHLAPPAATSSVFARHESFYIIHESRRRGANQHPVR